jgi:2-iminobutanoate/2-iminopropanoate deaminase
MNPKKYHLASSFALGFRDGLLIFGAMYLVITAYDLFNGTDSIRPMGDDYIMFMFFWTVIFLARAVFGKHPELPPRKPVRECLYTEFYRTSKAPKPIGSYSQAVARGNVMALAGQVGIDPETGEMAEGIAAQTRQALANLFAVVRSAKAAPGEIIQVRVYLANRDDFAAMNTAYREFFEEEGAFCDALPARTTVAVGLPEGMLVEIEALAVHQS